MLPASRDFNIQMQKWTDSYLGVPRSSNKQSTNNKTPKHATPPPPHPRLSHTHRCISMAAGWIWLRRSSVSWDGAVEPWVSSGCWLGALKFVIGLAWSDHWHAAPTHLPITPITVFDSFLILLYCWGLYYLLSLKTNSLLLLPSANSLKSITSSRQSCCWLFYDLLKY